MVVAIYGLPARYSIASAEGCDPMFDSPAVLGLHYIVVVGGGTDPALGKQCNDSKVQLDPIIGLVDVNVGHRVGPWMLGVNVHKHLDGFQTFEEGSAEICQIEYRVLGEDLVEPVPVPVIYGVAITTGQLVEF